MPEAVRGAQRSRANRPASHGEPLSSAKVQRSAQLPSYTETTRRNSNLGPEVRRYRRRTQEAHSRYRFVCLEPRRHPARFSRLGRHGASVELVRFRPDRTRRIQRPFPALFRCRVGPDGDDAGNGRRRSSHQVLGPAPFETGARHSSLEQRRRQGSEFQPRRPAVLRGQPTRRMVSRGCRKRQTGPQVQCRRCSAVGRILQPEGGAIGIPRQRRSSPILARRHRKTPLHPQTGPSSMIQTAPRQNIRADWRVPSANQVERGRLVACRC